jgi:hypothetical protein
MLHELSSNEYAIYTVVNRVVKDAYIFRKTQKDRSKLSKWLTALLKDREVILFYKENDIEIMTVASLKNDYGNLPEIPESFDEVNGQMRPAIHHCAFYEEPSRTPKLIHLDSITKFITLREGTTEISSKIRWVG